jgi:formylglycine-generating enzyme required for sulfatase activity
MSEATDFFVAGGTLRPTEPSYVTRPADGALLRHLQAGEFCYVLTPRQMGKSSLMVRTAQRLRTASTAVVLIDLTRIGSGALAADPWYLGILSGLRLTIDVETWWQAHAALGVAQRFTTFLHDVVLAECPQPVVILIDEIDATLNLPFRDDFFAALRAVYNERAGDPVYNRLTFGLLGVATPTDLIQDRERTPFNIGWRIELVEFTLQDAVPLQRGLAAHFPEQADALLQQIFTWTNGHPYLTQKLCQALVEEKTPADAGVLVDALVQKLFLSDEGRKDPNLTFVQDRIASSPPREQRQLLQLYRRIKRGDAVADDDRSPLQNRLELYGLVGVQQGRVQVRNQIYARVFNAGWIDAAMPSNPQRRWAILAATAALLLVIGVALFNNFRQPTACTVYSQQFNQKDSSLRLDALARLLAAQDRCGPLALDLFYSAPPEQQEALFLGITDLPAARTQLVTVIEGIYGTLDTTPEHDLELLDIWRTVLQNAGVGEAEQPLVTILHWREERTRFDQGDYAEAVAALAKALVPNHRVLTYDYALALAATGQYTAALTALDNVIQMSQPTWAPTTEQPAQSPLAPPFGTINSPLSLLPTPTSLTPTAVMRMPLEVTLTAIATMDAASPLRTHAVTRVIGSMSKPYLQRFATPDKVIAMVRQALESDLRLSSTFLQALSHPPALAQLPQLTALPLQSKLQIAATLSIPFVYVPAGSFMMGSPAGEGASDEHPQHEVTLDAYWISQTEVTNAQYRAFIEDGGYDQQDDWTISGWDWRASNNVTQPACWTGQQWNGDDYPVVCVSWYEAVVYTAWLSQTTGLTVRLPTEAEWERATRGDDGRLYPWGDEAPTDQLLNYNSNLGRTTAVGSYPAGISPYGAFDLAGNVWEWTSSQYLDYPYDRNDGREDPTGDARRVVRSSSWGSYQFVVRAAYRRRDVPDGGDSFLGFRVVLAVGLR